MTRKQYDLIIDAFSLGADFGGNSKREANWEYYKTVDPDDLLNELSYAYLKSWG